MAKSFLEALREALRGKEKDRVLDTEIGELGTRGPLGDMEIAAEGGISLTPTRLVSGDSIAIKYDGLLNKSGADQIYLHCGYGPGPWTRIRDIRMFKGSDGKWHSNVVVERGGTLEFCFRDNADNWDNNHGRNWSYTIMSDIPHNPS
ncbi:MAG: carbohydrate binding domain-containing protein [Limnochordia bacterium]|jgi:hypothetical protein